MQASVDPSDISHRGALTRNDAAQALFLSPDGLDLLRDDEAVLCDSGAERCLPVHASDFIIFPDEVSEDVDSEMPLHSEPHSDVTSFTSTQHSVAPTRAIDPDIVITGNDSHRRNAQSSTTLTIIPAEIHHDGVDHRPLELVANSDESPRQSEPCLRSAAGALHGSDTHKRSRDDDARLHDATSKRPNVPRLAPRSSTRVAQSTSHRRKARKPHPVRSTSEMYCSIGSADSIIQLKAMMPMIRSSNEWNWSRRGATIADVFKVLDRLEAIQQSCAFWRRIFLYRLAEHRDRLLENAQERRKLDTRFLRPRGVGKVEAEVIDDLTQEIYPHTVTRRRDLSVQQWRDSHVTERKKVSNRLTVARHWKRAVRRFQLGIFLLIPCGGQSGVQNHV